MCLSTSSPTGLKKSQMEEEKNGYVVAYKVMYEKNGGYVGEYYRRKKLLYKTGKVYTASGPMLEYANVAGSYQSGFHAYTRPLLTGGWGTLTCVKVHLYGVHTAGYQLPARRHLTVVARRMKIIGPMEEQPWRACGAWDLWRET